uniref:Uncharacterized protein n=1 Tax=Anguilla anguilla TaxID=7936 RepID=A0A0E9WJG4_ANGAN
MHLQNKLLWQRSCMSDLMGIDSYFSIDLLVFSFELMA